MSALPCRGPLRAATKSGGLPPDRTLTIAAPARSPLPLEPRLTPYGRVSSRASAASYRNSAARSERTNDRTENHRGAPPAHRDGAAARRDLVRRARDGRARGRDRRGVRARAAEPDPAGPGSVALHSVGGRVPRATYKRALPAGGTVVPEAAKQFFGDRHGSVRDPVGNVCGSPPTSRMCRPRASEARQDPPD